jgi:hypothetical protein
LRHPADVGQVSERLSALQFAGAGMAFGVYFRRLTNGAKLAREPGPDEPAGRRLIRE